MGLRTGELLPREKLRYLISWQFCNVEGWRCLSSVHLMLLFQPINIYNLEQGEEWKTNMIKELTLAKRGLLDNGLEAKVNGALLRDICIRGV